MCNLCLSNFSDLLNVSRPTSIVGYFIVENDEDIVQNESFNSTVHNGSVILSVQTETPLSDTPVSLLT